jgi:hypothetical protein
MLIPSEPSLTPFILSDRQVLQEIGNEHVDI